MSTTLTTGEIAAIAGKSPSTIQRLAKSQNWQPSARTGRGGSYVYELSKLPYEIQIAVLERRVVPLAGGTIPKKVVATKQQIIDARIHILSLLGDWLSDRKNFCIAYNSGNFPVKQEVKDIYPWVTPKQLLDWQNRIIKGITHLAPKDGGRRSGKTLIDSDPDIYNICLAFVTMRPAHIERELKERLGDRKIPCRKTIENWQEKWRSANPQKWALLTSKSKWKNKYQAAAGSYSESIFHANELWEIDGTKADIVCKDGRRYTVLALIDIYSRRTKLFVAPNNRSESVAQLLRSALLSWGVPKKIKFDLGSEFVNHHVKAICGSLKIEQDFCVGYSPEQKPHIERFFGTLTRSLLERLPGFCGHDVQERKDLGGAIKGVLTPLELQETLNKWVVDYELQDHSTIECSPLEQWAKSPYPTQAIQDERALDILLGESFTRIVAKKGIRFEKADYVDELGLWAVSIGSEVLIRCDKDQGKLHCFDLETGEFIFTAVNSQRLGISRQEHAARSHQQQKATKKAARAIKELSETLPTTSQAARAEVKPFGRKTSFESVALAAAAEVVAANLPAEPPAPLTDKQELRRVQEQQKQEEVKAQKPRSQESPGQRFYRLLCDRNRGASLMPEDNSFVDRCLAKKQFPALVRQAGIDTGGSPPARAN